MTGWSTSLKQRFASELIRGYASLVKHDGEYMRQVPVARAQMFTTNPQTGERFKISQVQKVETHMNDDGVAQRTRFDRRGEPYSLYRSLRNNNPEEALRARLREMGINPGAVKFQEFTSSVGVKESDTYTGMKTEYDYSDTTIEIPFDQLRDPNDIYAAHESGGVTDFELVKIEK